VLTILSAEIEKALAELQEAGRRRLAALLQETRDWISERSGRAVTPDCPRVPRGSDNTVEPHDSNNDIHLERWRQHLVEQFASEAEFLISLMAEAFAH
jgi:hypothetical protein